MAECIHGLDKNGYCEFINPAASQILGFEENELIGLRLHDLIHHHKEDGSERTEAECVVFQTLSDKQTRKCEDWFIRKDGSGFPVEVIIAPRYENDQFVGALLSYHDISQRRIVEEKLKESEELLSIAIEGAQDGIWDWRISSGEVFVTDIFAKMLGYTRKELTPFSVERWLEMMHLDDQESSRHLVQAHLDGKTNFYENTFRLKCKDGQWKWILSRGKIVSTDDTGKATRMTGTHTDISNQKQLESDLQQAKEYAEQANQAKSAFLSSMSHELRTPLNAILGFSQLLTFDPEVALTDSQKQNVDHIIKGGKHLLTLIDEVLQLSAIEAGKVELNIDSISLNDAVQEVLLLTQAIAKPQNINLQQLTTSEAFVKADGTKLKQVLLNLVSNAIKYNHEDGSVTIEWSTINKTHLKINVRDTGIGIEQSKQHKVFSAFNRLGLESSDIEGTGIGLVVTKGLVELMQGSIGFESIIDEGTNFWLELPLAEVVPSPHEEELTSSFSQGFHPHNIGTPVMRHILYVEDNQENSELMQGYFDMLPDLTLHVVETAEVALKTMGKHSFDLVLMDINLPGIDGITLTKKMRTLQDSNHIPVIAVTANAMPQDIEKTEGIFDAYLTKPIDFYILTETLTSYM